MTLARRLTTARAWVAAIVAALPPGAVGAGQASARPASGSLAPPSPALGRPAAMPSARVSPGERLYMRGFSVAAQPIDAMLQGDVHVKSTEMACVNCHRRSGMGTAEGPLVVPPIVGSVLFSPVTLGAPQIGPPRTTGPGTREAYTDETLLRAVRDGIGASGRPLSPTMPRYALGEADGKALAAFLRGLGEGVPPGVDDAILHVATIVGPGVSAGRRASMLDVLRTFVRAKNGGTRYEARRRTSGGWDMRQQYRVYRDWVLDEWVLHGPPPEWPAQLEALYRRQPVYAIVGGIVDDDWSPIDAFCARYRIPAVLPQTPLPPAEPSGEGFYSFYFSRGVLLEAEAIAHHLGASLPAGGVRQVARCGTPGAAAAAELARSLPAGAGRLECVPRTAKLDADAWPAIVDRDGALVLWLGAEDRAAIDAFATSPALDAVREVYLSSTLLGEEGAALPARIAAKAVLAHPFVVPDEFERHAARSLMWMKANDIHPSDRTVAVNALYAAVLASGVLGMPRAIDSREYFVEVIEHMTSRSISPTAYPSVTFDPKRRFGSAGAFLLKPPSSPGELFGKVEEWYVPGS